MQLVIQPQHQEEMRHAYFDGAPGILVSGVVWITAAVVCEWVGVHRGVWTLLIGGALIHPMGMVVAKLLKRPASTNKSNALNQLAAASTIWLILGCAMSYGLYKLMPALFFPAMMATIGSRYMILASVFGKSIYWLLGGCLLVAANLAFFTQVSPAIAAGIGGLIELVFAGLVFSSANKSV